MGQPPVRVLCTGLARGGGGALAIFPVNVTVSWANRLSGCSAPDWQGVEAEPLPIFPVNVTVLWANRLSGCSAPDWQGVEAEPLPIFGVNVMVLWLQLWFICQNREITPKQCA